VFCVRSTSQEVDGVVVTIWVFQCKREGKPPDGAALLVLLIFCCDGSDWLPCRCFSYLCMYIYIYMLRIASIGQCCCWTVPRKVGLRLASSACLNSTSTTIYSPLSGILPCLTLDDARFPSVFRIEIAMGFCSIGWAFLLTSAAFRKFAIAKNK